MPVREWDGDVYDRISAPQRSWGQDVLARLPLKGDETVIDAGCGSGRVTEMLLDRLPNGRVIGFDGSKSMAAAARRRLGDSVEVRVGDLLDLKVEEPVDAILSTATFHWIADHDTLFRRLRAALRDGGRLVAQCGGEGNVKRVHGTAHHVAGEAPFAEHFAGWRGPWNFSSAQLAERRLLSAGFSQARCRLTPAPVQPPEPREFLRAVILAPFVERLPTDLGERFVDDVHQRLGEPLVIDYVRLNIDAIA